jgi:hypothetical protein
MGIGSTTVNNGESLETDLCYSRIDGQIGVTDGQHNLDKFSPWWWKSQWSKMKRQKDYALIQVGQMVSLK